MDLVKIKKLGNAIYALGKKIEEAEKQGMVTRIQGYIEKLDDIQKELNTEIKKGLNQI